ASLPKGWTQEDMTLEKALTLLSLPRFVGDHPDGGQIHTNIGRYGPYVMHTTADDEGKEAKLYANIPDVEEVFTIGMNRAVEVIAEKRTKGGGRGRAAAKPLKELGEHPTEGGPVNVMDGRYGPYVKWEKVNATIPKETEPADVTMEQAVELITARAAKKGGRKKAAPKKKTATKKKPAAKKKTPVKKKPAAKKV
ncbi:MAG TPA: DNA topoisomerase I, partial [Rhodobacteraceae bacterium]|nr:DNA topoisomerase I [Paracoccaceae bacterium]